MDEKQKAKRFVSKSRKQKPKQESVKRAGRVKSKGAGPKSNNKKKVPLAPTPTLTPTTPKSNPTVSPHGERKEEKKEERKEEKVETPHEKKRSDRRAVDWREEKEPETESDHDADLGMKRSHVVLPNRKGKPQKVAIKHREVDEKEMEKLLKKLQENKSQPPRTPVTLDEKSKIFMDRVEKKPYPAKYSKKGVGSLLVDDDSEFFKPKVVKKKSSATIVPVEDSYDYAPKLSDVMKMDGENIYQKTLMGDVPFWAVYLEPDEKDSKDIDPPISVGSEHVEAYQNRTLTLKTPKSTKLVLDEFQPSCLLTTRDEKFFHPHLIFSNTVRSLINVQGHETEKSSMVQSPIPRSTGDDEGDNNIEESTQPDHVYNVTIPEKPVKVFRYDRDRPILSAREEKDRLSCPKAARSVPRESPKTPIDKSSSTNLDMERKQKVKSS
ncbi:unnamed protein product [Caenorhabditis brenneri]